MKKDRLIEEIKTLHLNVTEEMTNNLDIFCSFLLTENQKTNLTAINEIEDVYLKHVYDSLTLAKVVNFNEIENVLDIGSGAGFPGIILKIFFPHLKITLLDSNNKKTQFLNNAIKKLSLIDIEVINERAELFIQNKRETFDLVTARAVASLRILSELSIPYVKKSGKFVAMKSSIVEELEDAKEIISSLKGEIVETVCFKLPVENSHRCLIVVEKIDLTPKSYPRSYDKIVKNKVEKRI